jgi:hypothetical protein
MKSPFTKEKTEEPQVDSVPESGNVSLSEKEQQKIYEIEMKQQEAEEEARRLGKFFTLEIGESTEVIINFANTETFKTKTKNGDLVEQFRYELIDQRYPDRVKQFDTWWNVSEAIVRNVKAGHSKMVIKCQKNQVGGRKYVVVPYDAE